MFRRQFMKGQNSQPLSPDRSNRPSMSDIFGCGELTSPPVWTERSRSAAALMIIGAAALILLGQLAFSSVIVFLVLLSMPTKIIHIFHAHAATKKLCHPPRSGLAHVRFPPPTCRFGRAWRTPGADKQLATPLRTNWSVGKTSRRSHSLTILSRWRSFSHCPCFSRRRTCC